MTELSTVKLALPSDEGPLMELLRQMWKENGLASLDEDRVRHFLHRGIARDKAIIGVIRGPDTIEASVGLFVGTWWYSTENHIEDLFSYVATPYRRSTHAKSLIEFAKNCSMQLGMPLLMGVLSSDRTAAKVKLYERMLPKLGALFVYNGSEAPGLVSARPPSQTAAA